ncbi:MAG: hypothetical protein R3B46_01170 [Phycisphaerales bacterium]|nr:hypothetical protein [Phycisphaerales bacterium]
MKTRAVIACVAGIGVLMGAAVRASALPRYEIDLIPVLPLLEYININGFNNRGEVLITQLNAGPNLQIIATIWTADAGHRLLPSDIQYNSGSDLNDLGQALEGGGGWIWEPDGSMTPLPSQYWIQQINNTGQLFGVGWDADTGHYFPVISQGGGTTIVPISAPGDYRVHDANDLGVAIGSRYLYLGHGADGEPLYEYEGLRVTSSGVSTLDPLPGMQYALPYAMNNAGMIVGTSVQGDTRSGTVWLSDGTAIGMGADYYLYDINDLGQAVGSGPDGPFVWTSADGVQLIPSPTGTIDLLYALKINDHSQIVLVDASAFPQVGYLLTPIPDCPGDANGDNRVDVDDIEAVLSAWASVVPVGTGADLAGLDGYVNIDDLNAVLSGWGSDCSE